MVVQPTGTAPIPKNFTGYASFDEKVNSASERGQSVIRHGDLQQNDLRMFRTLWLSASDLEGSSLDSYSGTF